MYYCNMCKVNKDGEPRLSNNAGNFCQECFDEIQRRKIEGQKKHNNIIDGCCSWCGEPINEEQDAYEKLNGATNNVHRVCRKNREWLLKCIRFSAHSAKYVARIEKREAPIRKRKEKQLLAINSTVGTVEQENRLKVQEEQIKQQAVRLEQLERILKVRTGESSFSLSQQTA